MLLPLTCSLHADPRLTRVRPDVPTPDAEAEVHPVDMWAADLYSLRPHGDRLLGRRCVLSRACGLLQETGGTDTMED